MTLLIVGVAVVLVLWPVWFVLTREPKRRIKRAWTWRRVTIRTLDRLVLDADSGSNLVILVTFAPLIIYMFAAPLLGFRWTAIGMISSGTISLILMTIFAWRASKWMNRTFRSSRDWLRQHRPDYSKPSAEMRQSRSFKLGRKLARFKRGV